MRNADILSKAVVGEIIDNKQILAAMKKKGLIVDYSPWGYLESGRDKFGCLEYFPNGEREIEYMGCKFSTKYLDGCFSAYLQLVEKNGSREREVNPRMCLFGAII